MDLICTGMRRVRSDMPQIELRGCVHRQSATLVARLTMLCFLQADDKYKILADVPGG